MRNKCIVFFLDNQAVVEIINRQTSRDRSIMVLLRHFVLCTLKYNILFHAREPCFAPCLIYTVIQPLGVHRPVLCFVLLTDLQ